MQNFVSAATGIALAIALIRAFARASAKTVGNFWVDLTRCTLYVLLPLSIVTALVLSGTACRRTSIPMSMRRRWKAQSRHCARARCLADRDQAARHQWRRLLQRQLVAYPTRTRRRSAISSRCWASSLISAALTHTFGRMVKDARQGWALFAVMVGALPRALCCHLLGGGRRQSAIRRARRSIRRQHGRQGGAFRHRQFGLWAVATTDASNGSVNSMHDSYTPLGGMIRCSTSSSARSSIGGVGSGLYGMLLFVDPGRVHRRPDGRAHAGISRQEDRGEGGQDGDARDPDPAAVDPRLHGVAAVVPFGLSSLANAGPHGFSEILYALHLSHGQQRLAPSPASPAIRPGTTRPAASPC